MDRGAKIGLKHGSGGRAMRQLIEEVFLSLASPVDGIGLAALGSFRYAVAHFALNAS